MLFGNDGYEPEVTDEGECMIWLEEVRVNKLAALREPGESYSDVIVCLAKMEKAK